MTPQHRGLVPDPISKRILELVATRRRVEAELRGLVVEALRAGGSVREVAAVAEMSTNTVQRWKQEAGIVGPPRKKPLPKNWPPGL